MTLNLEEVRSRYVVQGCATRYDDRWDNGTVADLIDEIDRLRAGVDSLRAEKSVLARELAAARYAEEVFKTATAAIYEERDALRAEVGRLRQAMTEAANAAGRDWLREQIKLAAVLGG